MLGALAASGAFFGKVIILSEITRFFDEKGKNSPKNMDCFSLGFDGASVREALS
jgi:hypothetical protein